MYFSDSLTPKVDEFDPTFWDVFDGNKEIAKVFYEEGMADSFKEAYDSLCDDARMVVVFCPQRSECMGNPC